jgi:hypothetical protein
MLIRDLYFFEEKKRNHNQMRLKAEKEKNKLVNLSIKEKRSLRAQYKAQAHDEREAKRAADSNMKEYQDRVNTLRD